MRQWLSQCLSLCFKSGKVFYLVVHNHCCLPETFGGGMVTHQAQNFVTFAHLPSSPHTHDLWSIDPVAKYTLKNCLSFVNGWTLMEERSHLHFPVLSIIVFPRWSPPASNVCNPDLRERILYLNHKFDKIVKKTLRTTGLGKWPVISFSIRYPMVGNQKFTGSHKLALSSLPAMGIQRHTGNKILLARAVAIGRFSQHKFV